MNLIKELLSLNEEDDAGAEDITKMKQSPEKNIKAVDLILRSDGDIPVDRESQNQCDHMGEQDGKNMYYVSINPPHGDVEAYVVVDKSGNFSYYDFTDEVVVINGKFSMPGGDRVSNEWRDEMEEVINEYKLESGKVAPGGIDAYMALLKRSGD